MAPQQTLSQERRTTRRSQSNHGMEEEREMESIISPGTVQKDHAVAARFANDGEQGRGDAAAPMVTPLTVVESGTSQNVKQTPSQADARRVLFPPTSTSVRSSLVTPQRIAKRSWEQPEQAEIVAPPPAKRRLMFGKYVEWPSCPSNVEAVYKLVRKHTGAIGGNGCCGPIYGELTMGSMQKMVRLMMEHCNLSSSSRFIDVGSGIGKPNLHVAQYPGVAYSCGVEMEHARWVLGMTCLKAVLDVAVRQEQQITPENSSASDSSMIRGNTVFLHKNITEANSFDPFTHVYMFSIGFPPPLWVELADMWNRSQGSEYLICYHAPKDIIDCYGFEVELMTQAPTSMHGSKEGHTGYIYKRSPTNTSHRTKSKRVACDPLFRKSWDMVELGLDQLHGEVKREFEESMGSGRQTRSRAQGRFSRS